MRQVMESRVKIPHKAVAVNLFMPRQTGKSEYLPVSAAFCGEFYVLRTSGTANR